MTTESFGPWSQKDLTLMRNGLKQMGRGFDDTFHAEGRNMASGAGIGAVTALIANEALRNYAGYGFSNRDALVFGGVTGATGGAWNGAHTATRNFMNDPLISQQGFEKPDLTDGFVASLGRLGSLYNTRNCLYGNNSPIASTVINALAFTASNPVTVRGARMFGRGVIQPFFSAN